MTPYMAGARHCARLRGAIVGKSKSDVIDAEATRASEVFGPDAADTADACAVGVTSIGDPGVPAQ